MQMEPIRAYISGKQGTFPRDHVSVALGQGKGIAGAGKAKHDGF